jgi:hypothetical protein
MMLQSTLNSDNDEGFEAKKKQRQGIELQSEIIPSEEDRKALTDLLQSADQDIDESSLSGDSDEQVL